MRKHFDEWYRIRSNMPRHDQIDEVIGTLGAAAAVPLVAGLGRWGWNKFKNRHANRVQRVQAQEDPRNQNRPDHPANFAELTEQQPFITLIGNFAKNLGLKPPDPKHPLWLALARIAAARIYGPPMGAVEARDLAYVWNVISRPGSKGVSRAQRMGIIRPMYIPMAIPQVTAGTKYKATDDALEYDKMIAKQTQPQQAKQTTKSTTPTGQPQVPPQVPVGTPKPAQQKPYNNLPGHRTQAGGQFVDMLAQQIEKLEQQQTRSNNDNHLLALLQKTIELYTNQPWIKFKRRRQGGQGQGQGQGQQGQGGQGQGQQGQGAGPGP